MTQVSGISSGNIKPVEKIEKIKFNAIETALKREKEDVYKDFHGREDKKLGLADIKEAVDKLNDVLEEAHGEKYQFQIHEGTGRLLIKLVDIVNDVVIKEMPPEKILDLIANIWERVGIGIVDEWG